MKPILPVFLTFGFAALPAFACGTCGCMLNSDWASQGFTPNGGFRIDLRGDYFDQTQLRTGTGTVNPANLGVPSDQEIQQRTLNRISTLGIDYAPDANWGVNVQLPYIQRFHTTIAAGDTDVSTSRGSGLGDVRVVGRFQGFTEDHSFGIQLGVKLASGGIHDNFADGPQAGSPLDRGLQLGTGSTDLLLGLYKFGTLTTNWGYFANALWQSPFHTKEDFRPSASLSLSAGVRYTGFSAFTPQLQMNYRKENLESGANADVDNSGSTRVFLSPGASYRANQHLQLFGFLQVPVYQKVNGWQLEPKYIVSAGFRVSF